MADTGHWKVYGDIPENAYGFIYVIVNTTNHKKYIGKKQMVRKIRRNPLKGKKRKRIDYIESDWKTYTGSSDALNSDIASQGIDKFIFKILNHFFLVFRQISLLFHEIYTHLCQSTLR